MYFLLKLFNSSIHNLNNLHIQGKPQWKIPEKNISALKNPYFNILVYSKFIFYIFLVHKKGKKKYIFVQGF